MGPIEPMELIGLIGSVDLISPIGPISPMQCKAVLIYRSAPNGHAVEIKRWANLSKACRSDIIHANLKTMCAV